MQQKELHSLRLSHSECLCGAGVEDPEHILQACQTLPIERTRLWPSGADFRGQLWRSKEALQTTAQFIERPPPHLPRPYQRLNSNEQEETVHSLCLTILLHLNRNPTSTHWNLFISFDRSLIHDQIQLHVVYFLRILRLALPPSGTFKIKFDSK